MASKYIVTQVDPVGSGTVTRTENIVPRTVRYDTSYDYSEFRYYWNCDTLQANPAQGYEFDHWEIVVNQKWYKGISTPTGQSPFDREHTWNFALNEDYSKGNPLQITIEPDKTYPKYFDDNSPGYIESDVHVGSTNEEYFRPWIENIWTVTAVFKKSTPEPTYTHLPVYSISQNKLMYHTSANKLLRDSP